MLQKTPALVALALVLALGGCSTIKRATGQLDDTVLPGQRENVLPPDRQTARDPSVMGGNRQAGNSIGDDSLQRENADCLPDEPNCISQQPIAPAKKKQGSSTLQ